MPYPAPAADPSARPAPPPPTSQGRDRWLMAKKFLTRGRAVASFSPSSRAMARTMLDGIDWAAARCVVELGAGTGPITAELVARARPHTRLLVVEIDPEMGGRLKAKFPQVDVVIGDACHFDRLLADRGVTQVDHVLSGLPLPSFPADLRDGVLATSARMLSPAGTFRQLTVMPLIYYRLYARYYQDVRFRFVPLNLPPGGVYVCRGYRG
ncbi:MAG: methyltransferase domain-containing protein [Gemmataceae bacterium]|nr:methyltransferase domain-containing protein [Gemmataceae bacterium]